jgi:hypothetical protein
MKKSKISVATCMVLGGILLIYFGWIVAIKPSLKNYFNYHEIGQDAVFASAKVYIFLQKKTFLPIMPPETGGGIRRMVMHRSAKIRAASAMGVQYSKTVANLFYENMMNWPPARRAYASESATADSTCIAATPSGRTTRKVWKV